MVEGPAPSLTGKRRIPARKWRGAGEPTIGANPPRWGRSSFSASPTANPAGRRRRLVILGTHRQVLSRRRKAGRRIKLATFLGGACAALMAPPLAPAVAGGGGTSASGSGDGGSGGGGGGRGRG